MKFIYRIMAGLSVLMAVFMAIWGVFFFRSMVEEINDETDDMLESYSADIILRWLSGVDIPAIDNGSNNTYYIKKITADSAAVLPKISYENSMIYIAAKGETEAARIRHQIFMDINENYYQLTVAIPTFERKDLLKAILEWIVFLFVILLIGGLIITALVVEYNFRPLRALLKWFEGYVPGRKNPPVPDSGSVKEFSTLFKATQATADRMEKQYELQNQFIGNASHELQTPLAVCSGKIEMMLDSDEPLTRTQAEDLVQVHRKLQQMISLNRTLLLMTKIDNGQFIDVEPVDICSLVEDTVSMFNEIHNYRGVTASVVITGDLTVNMNSQLSNILVTNLLKNAFAHSPSGTKVNVVVGRGILSVSNDGSAPLDSDRIFDRFYQGDAKNTGSSGLGLSLVKSICSRYSIGLEYKYDGRHCFSLKFS